MMMMNLFCDQVNDPRWYKKKKNPDIAFYVTVFKVVDKIVYDNNVLLCHNECINM